MARMVWMRTPSVSIVITDIVWPPNVKMIPGFA
jgi:hypothetical protein